MPPQPLFAPVRPGKLPHPRFDLRRVRCRIPGAEKLPQPMDVLIGADCMYNKVVAKALARRCVEAFQTGARVLVLA